MARTRYKAYTEGVPYFLTSTIRNWMPLFAMRSLAEIVLDSLKFLHEQDRLILHGYVIMENHLHLVASAESMPKEMRSLKSFTARRIVDELTAQRQYRVLEQLCDLKKRHKEDQDHQVWEEGYHPQQILGQEMLKQKLEYIHNNPVRGGYVDDPAHWRYSSYRNYVGLDGLIPVNVIGL